MRILKRRYKFRFDDHFFYSGITYDLNEKRSTNFEPLCWSDGFLPRWNPEKKRWENVPRESAVLIRKTDFVVKEAQKQFAQYEKEIYSKVSESERRLMRQVAVLTDIVGDLIFLVKENHIHSERSLLNIMQTIQECDNSRAESELRAMQSLSVIEEAVRPRRNALREWLRYIVGKLFRT